LNYSFFVLELGGFGGSFVFVNQVHVADICCGEQQSADGLCRKVCCVSILRKLYCICVTIKLIICMFCWLLS